MADRAAARSWWEDVDRRTTPAGERSTPRRRASDHAPARADARPKLSLVVTEPVDLSTPVARLGEASRATIAANGRRTVTITGQRPAPPRRRPEPATRVGPRPDRIAMWAFFMGIFLVGVATATADAAPL